MLEKGRLDKNIVKEMKTENSSCSWREPVDRSTNQSKSPNKIVWRVTDDEDSEANKKRKRTIDATKTLDIIKKHITPPRLNEEKKTTKLSNSFSNERTYSEPESNNRTVQYTPPSNYTYFAKAVRTNSSLFNISDMEPQELSSSPSLNYLSSLRNSRNCFLQMEYTENKVQPRNRLSKLYALCQKKGELASSSNESQDNDVRGRLSGYGNSLSNSKEELFSRRTSSERSISYNYNNSRGSLTSWEQTFSDSMKKRSDTSVLGISNSSVEGEWYNDKSFSRAESHSSNLDNSTDSACSDWSSCDLFSGDKLWQTSRSSSLDRKWSRSNSRQAHNSLNNSFNLNDSRRISWGSNGSSLDRSPIKRKWSDEWFTLIERSSSSLDSSSYWNWPKSCDSIPKRKTLKKKHFGCAMDYHNNKKSLSNSLTESDKDRMYVLESCMYSCPIYLGEVFEAIDERIIGKHDEWMHRCKRRLVLLGDSHTRFLVFGLQFIFPSFAVEAMCKPSAKSEQVISGMEDTISSLTKDDFLILLCGTNDTWGESAEDAMIFLYNALEKIENTNILLCNLPQNYSVSEDSQVKRNISAFNNFLNDVYAYFENVKLVHLHMLKNSIFFTKHGLHFNETGKTKICELLAHKLVDYIDQINL